MGKVYRVPPSRIPDRKMLHSGLGTLVSPRHLANYSICPRQTRRSWHKHLRAPETSYDTKVISNVIKHCHLRSLKTGQLLSWRQVSTAVDNMFVRTAHLMKKRERPDFAEQYRHSRSILNRVQRWFSNYYLEGWSDPAIVNLPIIGRLTERCTLYHIQEMVSLGGPRMILSDFEERPHLENELTLKRALKNDYKMRAAWWTFYQATDIKADYWTRYIITPLTVHLVVLPITGDFIKTTGKIMKQWAYGITSGLFPPSYSSHCNECPFRAECDID